MAKYHASPYYQVGSVTFDMNGNYATDKAEEIAQLDALVPTWIKRVDEPVEETEEPQKPAPKAPRKAANTSAK
jgi:hypothetical protein